MPARPSDHDRFVALVLWHHGLSAGEIALLLHRTRSSVLALCQKSGGYPPRANMSIEERQAALDELADIRADENGEKIDGGLLPDRVFRAKALGGRQVKEAS